MDVPREIAEAVQPLFDILPRDRAMNVLAPKEGASAELRSAVERVFAQKPIVARPALQAGLWLYVDELDRSHTISQGIDNTTGSYWHGIMHRREGDFSNAHYWFSRTGAHPAMATLKGFDGHGLVDQAAAAYPENPLELVRKQQDEWANLFAWCANN